MQTLTPFIMLLAFLVSHPGLFEKFDSIFPQRSGNQFPCFSFHDYFKTDSTFKGVEIQTPLLSVIRETVLYDFKYFAVFKFSFSPLIDAYVVRQGSQYDESLIVLYLVETTSKRLVCKQELADAFGDGLWHFQKDAWLVDLNKDGSLDILNRRVDWESNGDQSRKTQDVFSAFVFSNSRFVPFKVDARNYYCRYKLRKIG